MAETNEDTGRTDDGRADDGRAALTAGWGIVDPDGPAPARAHYFEPSGLSVCRSWRIERAEGEITADPPAIEPCPLCRERSVLPHPPPLVGGTVPGGTVPDGIHGRVSTGTIER